VAVNIYWRYSIVLNSTPLVSILLPCRNAASTLDEALASLAAQTFGNFEILAVDDGSIDCTPTLLDEWTRRDARIRTFQSPQHGIVAALNEAASHSTGRLLARMDADDVASPTRLERQVEFLNTRSNIVACGTGVRYFPRRLIRDGARKYESWINGTISPAAIERDLFVECPIPHPTLVVRATAFHQLGGYLEVGWPEDYDLILRLWEAGYRFGKVPEVLLQWRERPDRLSRTDPRYAAEAFRRCKVHFIGRRIAGRPAIICGAGPVGKAFARALLANEHHVAAFIELDPQKIGQTIHGAPVVPWSDIRCHRDAYALAAVGSPEARWKIREHLLAAGFRELEDCCAVA
jgi:glycosyltransferase involved in cell wall biosynthesis